ncbi:peptide chain release factor H [Clostridia bacterium]|nr:peptide chain release factor H [Clostridia bacterium]
MNNRTMIQISSGQGPDECELAVGKLFAAICREFSGIEVIDKTPGKQAGCFKSIRLYGGGELRALEGSVQWVCVSPFRPKHKRKNWFVDVSVCAEADALSLREELIRFETFRSSGKGGQHVNKTDSGVRAIYEPTGNSVVVTDERSQHQNKQIAVERLRKLLAEKNQAGQDAARNSNWLENYKIVRGNPVRVYEEMEFRLTRGE